MKARGLDRINLGRLLRRKNLPHLATRAKPVLASFKRFDWKNFCSISLLLIYQDAVEIETSDSRVGSMLRLLVSEEAGRWIPYLEDGLVKCRSALGGGRYTPTLIFRCSSFSTLDVLGRRALHFLHLNP